LGLQALAKFLERSGAFTKTGRPRRETEPLVLSDDEEDEEDGGSEGGDGKGEESAQGGRLKTVSTPTPPHATRAGSFQRRFMCIFRYTGPTGSKTQKESEKGKKKREIERARGNLRLLFRIVVRECER
jgi:hypothetical protein